MRDGLVNQVLQILLAGDVAGDHGCLTAAVADRGGHGLARIGLAAGYHDLGAMLCQAFGDGTANAFAGTGNDRDLAGEVEQ